MLMPETQALIRNQFDDFLDDMAVHKSMYIRGILNAVLPNFMDPTGDVYTEEHAPGELLEFLKDQQKHFAPDLEDGEIVPINYKMISDRYGLGNEKGSWSVNTSGIAGQTQMALGQFFFARNGDDIWVGDIYDFEPKLHNAGMDIFGALTRDSALAAKTGTRSNVYTARWLGEWLMPEGDNPDERMQIKIKLPTEAKVVNMDYDNVPAVGQNFAFQGPMTNARQGMWSAFQSLQTSGAP